MKLHLAFDASDLPKFKADLLAYLPAMSSGHRLEALSAGLGLKTYAALTAALDSRIHLDEVDPEAFAARAVALGYDPKDLFPKTSIHSGEDGLAEVALEMVFRQVLSPHALTSRSWSWTKDAALVEVALSMEALIARAGVALRRFGMTRFDGVEAQRSPPAAGHFHVADSCQNGVYARIFTLAAYGERQVPYFEIVPQEQCCDAVEATRDAIGVIEASAERHGAVLVFQEVDDVPFLRPHLEARGYGLHPYDDAVMRGMVVKDFAKAFA